MKLLLEFSPFKASKREKVFLSTALKKFLSSPLSQISEQDLKAGKKIWAGARSSGSKALIFAFGGAGSSAKILSWLFPAKSGSVRLIDSMDRESFDRLSSLTKSELKSHSFLFISKSGQTKESLIWADFLKSAHLRHKLSLKKRATVLTQNAQSPLGKWAKKERGSVLIANSPLPGRFSFFALSGLAQAQAYGFDFSVKDLKARPSPIQALEFFIHHYSAKKEIFLCPLAPELKGLARWLELSWSESLFQPGAKKQAPILRSVSPSDFCHAFAEELIAKKSKSVFWAMDITSKNRPFSPYEPAIKKMLKAKKIPHVFMKLPLGDKNSLAEILLICHKILFCAGAFFKSDIYTQPGVDYLKKGLYSDLKIPSFYSKNP